MFASGTFAGSEDAVLERKAPVVLHPSVVRTDVGRVRGGVVEELALHRHADTGREHDRGFEALHVHDLEAVLAALERRRHEPEALHDLLALLGIGDAQRVRLVRVRPGHAERVAELLLHLLAVALDGVGPVVDGHLAGVDERLLEVAGDHVLGVVEVVVGVEHRIRQRGLEHRDSPLGHATFVRRKAYPSSSGMATVNPGR